ncbi:hypothetical protein BH23VER1_BH23VER1_32390 [soil metagenome]
MSHPVAGIPGRHSYRGWLIAAAFGLLALVLGIQENAYPYYYHIDEPTKTDQIVGGYRNFNHPLLLLVATDAALSLQGTPRTQQAAAVAGRTVSAVFTGLSGAAMALLASYKRGTLAAVCGGFFLATHWELFEKAHIFKEDPSLVFGLALTFLALFAYRSRPGLAAALFLGMAAGIATSSKYSGIIALICALPAPVLFKGSRGWFAPTATLLGAFLATVALFNCPVLTSEGFATFRASLVLETDKAVQGTWAEKETAFHFGYFKRLLYVGRAHMLPFFAWLLWVLLVVPGRRRWNFRYDDYLVALFPLLIAAILGFSTKNHGRYFLPGTLTLCYASGLGLAAILQSLAGSSFRFRKAAIAFLVLLAVAGSLERLTRYYQGFHGDPRVEMADFIRSSIPSNAVIVQGYGVHLPDPHLKLYSDGPVSGFFPQRLISSEKQPADLGSLDELRAQGVTHVAVCGQNYERYTKSTASPTPALADRYARRKRFYKDLFKEGTLVWERKADRIGTHNPPLKLYDIR